MDENWTHRCMVRRMALWLKNVKRMGVVVSELHTSNGEIPDVIGWSGEAVSILIECKASRSDFLSDKKKHFRREPDRGMGDKRYVAVPKGLVSPDEVPDEWGLLEIGKNSVRVRREADLVKSNKRSECVVLMSALRRLKISTAVYVVSDEMEGWPSGLRRRS